MRHGDAGVLQFGDAFGRDRARPDTRGHRALIIHAIGGGPTEPDDPHEPIEVPDQ